MESGAGRDGKGVSRWNGGTLKFLEKKIAVLNARVEWLETLENRGQVIICVLTEFWRDESIRQMLGANGLDNAPTGLICAALETPMAAPEGRASFLEASEGLDCRSAAEILKTAAAPTRALRLMLKLQPPRQRQVALLLSHSSDYRKIYLSALLAATPVDQRVVRMQLSVRRRALQADLAKAEDRLRRLLVRESQALEVCGGGAFALTLAGNYIRRLWTAPTVMRWLGENRPALASALRDFAVSTSSPLGKAPFPDPF